MDCACLKLCTSRGVERISGVARSAPRRRPGRRKDMCEVEGRWVWRYAESWRSIGAFLGTMNGVLEADRKAREAN